jgi:uncharacterized membrane protein
MYLVHRHTILPLAPRFAVATPPCVEVICGLSLRAELLSGRSMIELITKALFIGIAFVAAMLAVAGFMADKDAFIINLLTAGIGLLGSVALGFTLVAYWTRRRLAFQWSAVRSQTLYRITTRLSEFLWDCYSIWWRTWSFGAEIQR